MDEAITTTISIIKEYVNTHVIGLYFPCQFLFSETFINMGIHERTRMKANIINSIAMMI